MRAKIPGATLFFDVDGVQFAPSGDRMIERPVVFLLHGGPGGDHAFYKSQISALRDVAQLVYIDHRGSGRSTVEDPATCTLDQNIADVDALREYLGLPRIAVMGVSYGGMVAQGYAIRYPDRVSSLILSATAPSYRFIDDAKRILAARGTPEQIRVCERLWNASFESIDQLLEYYAVVGPLYSVRFDATLAEAYSRRSIRNYEQLNLGFGGFLRTFDFTPDLHRIHCPTLVLAGAHDWICPPNQSRLIAERIPRAHLKIFANSSHSIGADEPEEYLAALRGFLTYPQA